MSRRTRAYIGLGSNLGDARKTLENAVKALGALPGARVRAVSRLYRTRPVGVTAQPDFMNAVVALDVPTSRDPQIGALALLAALKGLEHAFGRQKRQRWGPRELDLDLLIFGRHRIEAHQPDGLWLRVPHPDAQERLFVLTPLADISPGLRPPGWSETVATARRRQFEVEGADAVQDAGSISGDRQATMS